MAQTAEQQPEIRGFWSWFAQHQAEILDIMSGRKQGRVTQLLDEALAAHGLSVTYEVTEGPYGGELSFTPEGDPQVARFVDRFVAAAPTLERWVIHSRIQRKSLPAALAFVQRVHGVDLSEARLKVRCVEGLYFLQFLHDGLAALPDPKRMAAAASFLDHALGEALTMGFVRGLDFRSGGEGIEMSLVISELIRETGIDTGDLPSV